MGETEPEVSGTHLMRNLQRPSAQDQNRLSTHFVPDLGIVPANPPAPTGSDGFERRFFSGKANSVVLVSTSALLAVGHLMVCESAIAEPLSPADHRQPQLLNLNDIGPDSDDHRLFS